VVRTVPVDGFRLKRNGVVVLQLPFSARVNGVVTCSVPAGWPAGTYVVEVTAYNTVGEAAVSLPLSVTGSEPPPPQCTYAITPTSRGVVAAGGANTVAVTAGTGCAWTAVSNASSWLTVTSGASGTGNGSVGYTVAANPNTVTRSGTLTIAGQTFTVNQQAAPCTYAIAPSSNALPDTGGTGVVTVTAPTGCAWTSVSNDPWLTVTAGGTGSGSVGYTVASTTTARTGTATIAGQTFTVTQTAPPQSAPAITSITPTSGPTAGGTRIVITGTAFGTATAPPEVQIDGVQVPRVSHDGSRSVTVDTPPHAAGPVPVTILNNDGGTTTAPAGFEYLAPVESLTGEQRTAKCRFVLTDTKPDSATGWGVQFRFNNADGTYTNIGSRDSTAPYTRTSVEKPVGTYRVSALWTRTGSPSVVHGPITLTCVAQ
jgi:hypothetical protein